MNVVMTTPHPERTPDPSSDREPMPLRIAGRLNPALLAPPTVAHLEEAPALRAVIDCTVASRLRSRARYPHTVIRGPRDSGKVSIAAVIAAEMAVPLRVLDWADIRSPQGLHDFFREIPEHGIAVVRRVDLVPAPMMRDISLAARRARIPVGRPSEAWAAELEKLSGRRGPRRYADFTIIGTAEDAISPSAPFTRWAERTLNVHRTPAGEEARLSRVFRRVGAAFEPDAMKALAGYSSGLQLRTLASAEAVLDWMAHHGVAVLDLAAVGRAIEAVLQPCAEPEDLERMRETLAASAAQESEAAKAGKGRVIVP